MNKSRDISRSFYLKKLLDKQLDKANPKLDHKGRQAEAEAQMDKLLGPAWRKFIGDGGVTVVEIETTAEPTHEDPTSFFEKVKNAGMNEGLGYKDADYDETIDKDEDSSECQKETIMAQFKRILDKVLG